MSIGITVLPVTLTRVAPSGTRMPAAAPACTMRAPSTISVAFSIGALPSPTMSRAPSNAVTPPAGACARAGTAAAATTPRARVVVSANAFSRRIGASRWNLDERTGFAVTLYLFLDVRNTDKLTRFGIGGISGDASPIDLGQDLFDDAGACLRLGNLEGRLATEDSEPFPQPPLRVPGIA